LLVHVFSFLVCSAPMTSAGVCEFPTFMTDTYWHANITYPGYTSFGALWTFPNHSQAQLRHLVDTATKKTLYSCLAAIDSDTFFASIATEPPSSTAYQCLRFIKRSDFVVQLTHSTIFTSSSPDQCPNSAQFELQPSLLVQTETTSDEPISCGLAGGYWLSTGAGACRDSFLHPIMESDCASPGEGVLIDFRQPTCALRSLTVSQKLVCLGSWTQSGSTFSVLTNDKDSVIPRFWMLKIPEHATGPITVHLLTSLSTSPSHNTNQQSLDLTPASFSTLCENEATGCDATMCDDDNTEVHCQKTCDACPVASVGSSCQFNASYVGQLVEMSRRHAAHNGYLTVCKRYATIVSE